MMYIMRIMHDAYDAGCIQYTLRSATNEFQIFITDRIVIGIAAL